MVVEWNSYFNALIVRSDQSLYPLQNFLIVGRTAVTASPASVEQYQRVLAEETLLRNAVIVVATVPSAISARG
jgi:ABC-type glycerol-3-phosphate transport system permease component